MSEILYAWYSKEAAKWHGSSIYAREDGTEVEVTSADRKIENGKDYLWEDKKYVGEVVRYVRKGKRKSSEYEKYFSFLPVDNSCPIRRILP